MLCLSDTLPSDGTQQTSNRVHREFAMSSPERQLEEQLLEKLRGLKCYDVILLMNGVPAVPIELKTLGIRPLNFPRRAIEQIVEYKTTPGNGYSKARP
ncbi:MAG: type I restriction enzyme HsdR N-terminal domain-containing protein [Planctomycetota bacterium]